MNNKRSSRQHEVLRVPQGWNGQDKGLVVQLERILDDIYNRLASSVKSILGIKPDKDGNVQLTKESLSGLVPVVVDSLDDESADKALSAKRGKELKDAITVESVSSPVTWDNAVVSNADCVATMYAIGSLRVLHLGIYVRNDISAFTVIGTIKSGHRPSASSVNAVSTTIGTTDQIARFVQARSTGQIRMSQATASTSESTMFYATIVYTV